jgi:hypothetical protein
MLRISPGSLRNGNGVSWRGGAEGTCKVVRVARLLILDSFTEAIDLVFLV